MSGADPASDAALIARSLDEPAVFGALFERHFDAVFGYFARRVPRSEAGDLAAETFRVAFDVRAGFDPTRARARPWLYGIATNVLRHHLRRQGREGLAVRRLAPVPDRVDAGEAAMVAAVDAAARWPAVASALAALAPNDREALLLLAWEGLGYAEIAEATEVPVGTVRSRIHRARRQVRELIGDGGQLPDDTHPLVPEEATDHG